MTKNQTLLLTAGVCAFVVASVCGYFLLPYHKPAPQTRQPAANRPNAPASRSAKPDPAAIDNRRRTAASATLAMLQGYATDNAGLYPTTAVALRQAVDTYGKTIASSTIVAYKQSYDPADVPKATDMFYYPGYTCTGTGPTLSSSRSVAVRYLLSDGTYACTSS